MGGFTADDKEQKAAAVGLDFGQYSNQFTVVITNYLPHRDTFDISCTLCLEVSVMHSSKLEIFLEHWSSVTNTCCILLA